MSTDDIVALLVLERDKLNRAIEALQVEIPTKTAGAVHSQGGSNGPGEHNKKRVISAETRQRMALGQQKRHAAKKNAAMS